MAERTSWGMIAFLGLHSQGAVLAASNKASMKINCQHANAECGST